MRTIDRRSLGPRGLTFGAGLAVGLAVAAHGVAASSVGTPCPSPGATKPPVAVAHPAHQAQLFVADKHMWRLPLTRVAVISELHGTYDSSRARGKYVVVFMTAQNVGKVPQTLAIDQDFAVTDAQGRQFGRANSDANSAAYQKYKLDDYYDTVQPTFSERVAVVFDVARDARGLTLVNVPLFSDRTQKLFTLGI